LLLFALVYTGRNEYMTRGKVLLLLGPAVAGTILTATNEFHHLFSTGGVQTQNGLEVIVNEGRLAFWLFTAYLNGCVVFGMYLLLEETIDGAEQCPVEAVPKLDIAIENLVENAVEHNDATRPRVSVEVTNGDRPTLVVSDNGPGIPEQEIAALEGERETSLEHGSGIGLWLVKWIVDRSNAE
jgi:signal transduction histidine kinase